MRLRKKALFIAATGQNVGKTTLCLGILANLKKRFDRVGFIKPIGQQHVKVENGINVDKDVVLFKKYFNLPEEWEDMSPIIIPGGFTRQFLDEEVTEHFLEQKIKKSFYQIYEQNAYTVVEGTGHVGVGSIVNMNNAKVASQLGLDVVIIASGGLGSTHDELAMNVTMCQHYGLKIEGVILNRVLDDKREMIMEYIPKSLKKWGIPLLGCVPFNAFLNTPAIKDFESLFNTTLLSGEQHRYRHFQNTRLVAGSLETYCQEMEPNELIITPASREDIIQAVLEKHRESLDKDNKDYQCGMILTSKHPPRPEIIEKIRLEDIPVLYAPLCSYDVMKMITSFIAKIRMEDVLKVEKAIKLVGDHVNFDLLCN